VLLPEKTGWPACPTAPIAACGDRAAAALLPACSDTGPKAPGPQGDRFPAIALPDLDGALSPLSAYANVALVVISGPTWCDRAGAECPTWKTECAVRPEDLRVSAYGSTTMPTLRANLACPQAHIPLLSDSNQALSNQGLCALPASYNLLAKRDHSIASIIVGARNGRTKMVERSKKTRQAGCAARAAV